MPDVPDLRASLGAVAIQRDVVRVSGPDAVEYLQGQLSQDVLSLEDGGSARSLLLQPTGKVDAWLRVTRVGPEELMLDVDSGFGDQVHARLQRFKLRTKVDLTCERWSGLAVRGSGASDVDAPSGAMALPAGWPGIEGVDLLSDGELAVAGIPLVDSDALHALRVECGVPAMGSELTDATIPAEAGQWLIDSSVSFTKGCYTGQELVARVDSRGGNVPRPLRGLKVAASSEVSAAALVGADVESAGRSIGTVTSAATSPRLGLIALALVGRAAAVGDVVELRWADGSGEATIAGLPFL
ncbi:MAG: YgfZ/GcvT domain-containing protein [Actinomycetota bacterium]